MTVGVIVFAAAVIFAAFTAGFALTVLLSADAVFVNVLTVFAVCMCMALAAAVYTFFMMIMVAVSAAAAVIMVLHRFHRMLFENRFHQCFLLITII